MAIDWSSYSSFKAAKAGKKEEEEVTTNAPPSIDWGSFNSWKKTKAATPASKPVTGNAAGRVGGLQPALAGNSIGAPLPKKEVEPTTGQFNYVNGHMVRDSQGNPVVTGGEFDTTTDKLGRVIGAIPSGFVSKAHTLAGAVGMGVMAPASVLDTITGGTEATDWVGRNLVDPGFQRAAEYAPKEGADSYEKIGSGLGGVAVDMPFMIGMGAMSAAEKAAAVSKGLYEYAASALGSSAKSALLPAVTAATSTAKQVIDAGGSPEEAYQAGVAELGATTAMLATPMNVAGNLGTRVATGAALGPVTSAAATAGVNPFLPEKLRRDPFDPSEAVVAAATGGILSAMPHSLPKFPAKAAEGAGLAREKLANAGALDATKAEDVPATTSFKPDPSINKALETQATKTVSNRMSLPEAGSVIDNHVESLRKASTDGLLDPGSVKALQRDEEELRLTLQEDEKRRGAGILQTPERPYLSEQAKKLIAERRSEIRERLEKHRAAVGYGNELRDVEAKLSKLGESDSEVVDLAHKLARKPIEEKVVPVVKEAPKATAVEQKPVTVTATTALTTTEPATKVRVNLTDKKAEANAAARFVLAIQKNPELIQIYAKDPSLKDAHMATLVAEEKAKLKTITSTKKTKEASSSITTKEPVSIGEAPIVPRVTGPVNTSEIVLAKKAWNTLTERVRATLLNGKTLKEVGDNVVLSTVTIPRTLETSSVTSEQATSPVSPVPPAQDSSVRVEATTKPVEPSKELPATLVPATTEKAPVAPPTQPEGASKTVPTEVPATTVKENANGLKEGMQREGQQGTEANQEVDLAIGGTTKEETHANSEDFKKELYSGILSPEATDAKELGDSAVVYHGLAELEASHPEVAARVKAAMPAQSSGAGGVKGFYDPPTHKVYLDSSLIPKGQAKRVFVHEASTHMANREDIARGRALQRRVEAFAAMGNESAKAAVEKVAKRYDKLGALAAAGDRAADFKYNDEILAHFITHMYDKYKSGKGLIGTAARLYTDVLSYFRNKYTHALHSVGKKVGLANKLKLEMNELDILDAIRYGYKIEGFKAPAKVKQEAPLLKVKGVSKENNDNTPSFSLASSKTVSDKENNPYRNIASKIVDTAKKALVYHGTGSKETFDSVSQMQGFNNSVLWDLQNKLTDVVAAAKKSMGKRWEMYNQDAIAFLQGNTGAGARLPAKVREGINSIREQVDSLSMKLMALDVLTPKQLATFVANLGKWTHQSYAAWDLKQGEWKDLLLAPGGKGKELIEEAIPSIIQDIAIPADKKLDSLLAKAQNTKKPKGAALAMAKLQKIMFNYGLFSNQKDLAANVTELKKLRDTMTPEETVANARALAEKLLDPKAVSEKGYMPYKAFQTDESALKKNTKTPSWLKNLWGAPKEFDAVAIATVHAISDLVAKHSVLAANKQRMLDAGVLVKGSAPVGYTPLTSDNKMTYGALDGYSIRNEDYGLVKQLADSGAANTAASMFGAQTNNLIHNALVQLSAGAKMAAVPLRPTTAFINFVSSVSVLPFFAGVPFKNFGKGWRTARREALNVVPMLPWANMTTKQADGDFHKDITFLMQRGVLADVALSQDMRSELRDQVIDEAYKQAPWLRQKVHKAGSNWGKVKDTASRVNAFGDSTGKVMSFYSRVSWLTRAHPELSADQVRELAAEHVLGTMPSFSRAAPLARWTSRYALFFGSFATFTAEMYRNLKNDMSIGGKYLYEGYKENNPQKAAYGALNITTAGIKAGLIKAAYGGVAFGVHALAGLFDAGPSDGDEDKDKVRGYAAGKAIMDDDKKRAAARKLMPPYFRGDAIVLREVAPHTFTTITTSRLDPLTIGPMLSAYQNGDSAEDIAMLAVQPFVGESLLGGSLTDLASGAIEMQDPNKARAQAGRDKFMRGFSDIAQGLNPGIIKDVVVKPMFDRAIKEVDLTGFENFLDQTGMTVTQVDFDEQLARRFQEASQLLNSATSSMGEEVTTKTREEVALGDKPFGDSYVDAVTKQVKIFQDTLPYVQAARDFGYKDEEIEQVLDTFDVSLDKDFFYGLMDGKFIIPEPDKVIDRAYESELKKAEGNPTKTQELDAKYQKALDDAYGRLDAIKAILKSEGIPYYDE